MKLFLKGAMLAALAGTPAIAWQTQTDFRGLVINDLVQGPLEIKVICDPGGAFIPAADQAILTLEGQLPDGPFTLSADTGSVSGTLEAGLISNRNGGIWTSFARLLMTGSRFDLTVADQTITIQTKSALPETCLPGRS
ncbi:hypothetical protein D3P06_06960 [Paracoccus aestuarii]|uniref:Uncharacterized protein n=1 Tax=Paracoccus aestuarii TaxID=453842 RepID=A0A418ZYA5_9RHOB|nr:hypothetical protein [Paracoccus aestuarii]RJL05479.1 hypothetical protein D3P06_06960 [Paracoccus aestuarii]WCR01277.1 hypothetical protein JHW48_18110 [Paracoccus aestuarii]